MFSIFRTRPIVSLCAFSFFLGSLLLRLLLGRLYGGMIREVDNMAVTDNPLLKQCKLKFTNCYRQNGNVPNIPVFVDKFISRLAAGPLSFGALYHLSGQLMLLSVVFSGIGVCRVLVAGGGIMDILPFYIVAFAELYLYFVVCTLVDIRERRRVLKINLVDYLENHLAGRIEATSALVSPDQEARAQAEPKSDLQRSPMRAVQTEKPEVRRQREGQRSQTKESDSEGQMENQKELEALLAEFLTL